MGMVKFKAPRLPDPDEGYSEDREYQLIRALELYFADLDSNTSIKADDYFIVGSTGILSSVEVDARRYALLVS